jgi:Tfp pilus assembly protein PilV
VPQPKLKQVILESVRTRFRSTKGGAIRFIVVRIVLRSKNFPVLPSAVRERSSQGGFALIEILVAGALLAFVVFSLYSAFSFGFTTIRVTQENLRADQILVQKLETLRMYDWSKISSSYIPASFTATYSSGGSNQGVTYAGAISIVPAPLTESYSNTLRQVTVTLSWLSGGVPRTRSMTTFVAQNGIQTYKP